MKTTNLMLAAAVILSLVLVVVPVSARVGIKQIETGDMIFVYEANLDLSLIRDIGTPGSCGGVAGCNLLTTSGTCNQNENLECTWNPAIDAYCTGGAACTGVTPQGVCVGTVAVPGFCSGSSPACTGPANGPACTAADVSCSWTAPVQCNWVPAVAASCTGVAGCGAYATIGDCNQNEDLACTWTPAVTNEIVSLVKCSDTPSGGTCPEEHEIGVADDTDFTLYGSSTAGYYGIYYASDGGPLDTSKYVRIQQATSTLDVVLADYHYDSVNGETITRDSDIAFKITSSNVGSNYEDGTGTIHAKLDLQVSTPGGSTLTTFCGLNLEDIPVDAPEKYTGACDLGAVESGKYTVRAKWSSPVEFVNQAPDSNTISFTVSSKALTITANKESVVKGNNFAVTVMGESRKEYYLYVKSGATQNPVFLAGQTDVTQMVAPSGVTDEAGYTGTFAKVKTGSGGSITVEFTTNNITDDESYAIKVRDTDLSKTTDDTVTVDVQKGQITIVMGGTGSYYMGEEITLTGTNSESEEVYLFMVGPNLNSNGVKISDPGTPCVKNNVNTFEVVDVDADNTWEYKWQTSDFTTVLDSGTYTVYAASDPVGRNDLSDTTYESAGITLKDSFITIQLSSNSVASGDIFKITGTASGAPDRVYVWIFGKNYRNMYNSVTVKSDGTYEYKMTSADTDNLYSGQYYLLIQHPMANGAGIYATSDGKGTKCSGLGCSYIEGDVDTWNFGPVKLVGLQAPDAAQALTEAIDSPNVDDVYAKATFTVDNAFIRILPITDKQIGDQISIKGYTNLATGDKIQIEVISASFQPTNKSQSSEFSAGTGSVTVMKPDSESFGYNTFGITFDTATWKMDEYIVRAECIETGTLATTTFNLLSTPPTPIFTIPTPLPTPLPTPPTIIPTPLPTPPTVEPTAVPTETPGFGVLVAIVGLGAVVFFCVLRREQ